MLNHSLSRSRGSSAVFWKKHLQQHRASGLSVAAFCRLHSLGVASFYAWRRRLLDGATSVPASVPTFVPASAEVEQKGISWREVSLSVPGPREPASATGQEGPPGLASSSRNQINCKRKSLTIFMKLQFSFTPLRLVPSLLALFPSISCRRSVSIISN